MQSRKRKIMEKIYYVDALEKKRLQKEYIRTSKGAMALSIGLLAVLILFTITFVVYGFVLKDTFLVRDITDSDYGEKNKLLVWVVLIAGDIILAFLWFIQKLVIYGIFGKYIDQRVNESLIISDDEVEYGYQNAVGATAGDRVIVKVPTESIKKIIIDRNISRIELIGMVSSKYYENYSQKKTRAPKNNYKEGSLVLFDYFNPKISGFLEDKYSERVEVK